MLGLRDILLIAPTHQQNQPISISSDPAALGVGLGIFPLLTATPCGGGPDAPTSAAEPNSDASRFWSLRSTTYPEMNHPSSKHHDMLSFGGGAVESDEGGGGGGDEDSGGGLRACKDCGNRAKKGCEYFRCRTCCRGRGYDCSTHVRSTWIPAARRRERGHMGVTVAVPGGAAAAASGGDPEGSSGSSSVAKRPRVMMPSKNASTASYSNLRPSLPDQVRAPAVFKCQRVTSIGNGEAEIAYQATVKISGHVFKGLLYDRGFDKKSEYPCISHIMHLGSGSNQRNGDSSSPTVPPSNVCVASTG